MQQTLALFDEIPDVETLRTKREDQWFDRKSFRIKDYDLAADMIGFANADGGRIVVGIHNGEIEGINSDIKHLNTLLMAAINFTAPPVRYVDAYRALPALRWSNSGNRRPLQSPEGCPSGRHDSSVD